MGFLHLPEISRVSSYVVLGRLNANEMQDLTIHMLCSHFNADILDLHVYLYNLPAAPDGGVEPHFTSLIPRPPN